MLANQGGVRALAQILRQLQPAAEQQFAAARASTDGDAQVDHPLRVGKEDIAKAAAGSPEAIGNGRQLPVIALRHQRGHVGGEQQAQVTGVASVTQLGVPLNAVEGQEGDARHQQAYHQGRHRQQLGLQAELLPPAIQGLAPAHRLRTWWPMSRR